MIVFVCSLIGFILFLYLVQRGTLQQQEEALAFICYQEPNTCFNTDDALFYKFR